MVMRYIKEYKEWKNIKEDYGYGYDNEDMQDEEGIQVKDLYIGDEVKCLTNDLIEKISNKIGTIIKFFEFGDNSWVKIKFNNGEEYDMPFNNKYLEPVSLS